MFSSILNLVGNAIKPITDLIDNLTTSKEEQLELRNKLVEVQANLSKEILDYTEKEVAAQKEIIVAEIKSGWLSRNWRPILMLVIVAIIANNYLIYPYLSMFTDKVTVLELPSELYTLMTIGVGGYITGRSAEKITDTIKNKKGGK